MSNELVEKIKKSFFIKDRVYRTDVLEIIGDNDDRYFDQAMNEMLKEEEVLFAYENAAVDNLFGFIFYKSKGKLIREYIYADNNELEYDLTMTQWRYPTVEDLSSIELREFALKLRDYVNYNELPISILPENIYEDIKKTKNNHQIDKKTENRIILLAKFWRLGYFFLLFPGWLIFRNLLVSETKLLLLSSYIIFYGGYLVLGSFKGFRHIYCAYQDWEGKKMTPSIVNWKSIGTIKYFMPGFFCLVGLGSFIVYLTMI